MGKTGMSKVEEINAVEEVEGDKINGVNYSMGVRAAIRLQPRPCSPDSIYK